MQSVAVPSQRTTGRCCLVVVFMDAVALAGVTAFAQSGVEIRYGPELLINGSLEEDVDADGVPDGWRRSVQSNPGERAEAEMVTEAENAADGQRCLRIEWKTKKGAIQARLIQLVKANPGKVHEIAYWYRSGLDPRLHADVLLTGTGPAYRNWGHRPTARWARKVVRFLIPEHVRGKRPQDIGEVGEVAVLIQNRGIVPIWYDGVSFRETDLAETDLERLTCEVRLSPKSSDDSVVFPNSGRAECRFGVTAKAPGKNAEDLSLEVFLGVGASLTPLGRLDLDGDEVRVSVASLPIGKSQLIAYLWNRPSRELLADHEQTLQRFSPDEVPADVDLEKAPLFLDKGKPFFPIGVYGFDPPRTPEQCEELKAHGFNTIHSYVPEGSQALTKTERVRQYLNMAKTYGFRTVLGMPRGIAESDRQPELGPWVREFGSDPTVLFFYSDEMVCIRGSSIGRVASLHRLLRKNAPSIPYLPYEPADPELTPHVDGLIWGATTTRSEGLVYRARLGPTKPHIGVQHIDQNTQPPQDAEQEYRVFIPVIHGARGWFLFMWSWAKWNRPDPGYFQRMLTSVEHLAEIAPAIISEQPVPEWTPTVEESEDLSLLRCALADRVFFLLGPSFPGRPGKMTVDVPKGIRGRRMWRNPEQTVGAGRHELPVAPRTVTVLEFSRTH